jgi:hypothetical protein
MRFSDVAAQYEDELQDHVVVIADGAATDGQLECAARVQVESGYWTEVPDSLRMRYFEHYGRVSTEWSKRWALRELEARGELERLPVYEAGTTDEVEFARTLEGLCGEEAQGMLQSGYGPHTVSPEWVRDREDFEQMGQTLMCIMRFSAASGFALGFVGNEKVAEPSGGQ